VNFKLLAWIIGPILALFVLGYIVIAIVGTVLSWLFSIVFYLAIGLLVVGVAIWGYNKVRGKLGSGNQHRQIR
jgi:tetrahydromethanopterin S-methyltransferase subunit C